MVHALHPTQKLGFGMLSPRNVERLHAAVELGYLIGSLLFTIGTVYFFPTEWLEDFVVGCRYYEVGSLIFMLLTFYCELDGHEARKRADENRTVTKRELLEQTLWCLGSFVFLVGTFLFDPPIVSAIAGRAKSATGRVENVAAILFMIGSFMFSLGSYVNGLSIFEAPRMFRKHLITVTTCYQFGGLLFVAGTMGYVEAFEPNLTMRWCATWMYLVGCFFYVAGGVISFVRTVASQQLSWERKQARDDSKRCRREMSLARLVGRRQTNADSSSAQPSKLIRRRVAEGRHRVLEEWDDEDDEDPLGFAGASPLSASAVLASSASPTRPSAAEPGASPASGASSGGPAVVDGLDSFGPADLEAAQLRLTEQLEAVLGQEAGQELAAALRDQDDGLLEEEDLFGAFWRSVWAAPSIEGEGHMAASSSTGAAPGAAVGALGAAGAGARVAGLAGATSVRIDSAAEAAATSDADAAAGARAEGFGGRRNAAAAALASAAVSPLPSMQMREHGRDAAFKDNLPFL